MPPQPQSPSPTSSTMVEVHTVELTGSSSSSVAQCDPDVSPERERVGVTIAWTGITKTVPPPPAPPSLLKSSIGGGGSSSSPASPTSPPLSTKPADKQILSSVSGAALPGQILALMGPSGSGKTTLLDCLSNRGFITEGTITLNGEPVQKKHKRMIAYVMQEDIFFEHLTVRDQLLYTALLRLPDSDTFASKLAAVDAVISQLKLTKCENTPIILISGGEKKRTNIGTELLTDPQAILLDEPTSGLDSTSAV